MRFLYAHGFASGPQSGKARAFKEAFSENGISLEVPALDADDFEHLTISGQLAVIEKILAGEPARLIGSSMGGYLAALYAALHPEVGRLVLLAPAFGFASRWREKAKAGADLEVFHYGSRSARRVHYGLIEDSLKFPGEPDFSQPALIFHGTHDDVVPIQFSRDFVTGHPNVRLTELDSGHELIDVLDEIVAEAMPFLYSQAPSSRLN